jgi:hypothetical protein
MDYKKNATVETDDFWYDLIDGGYIKPEKILANPNDVKKIKYAIKVLENWKNDLEKNDIIQYS